MEFKLILKRIGKWLTLSYGSDINISKWEIVEKSGITTQNRG